MRGHKARRAHHRGKAAHARTFNDGARFMLYLVVGVPIASVGLACWVSGLVAIVVPWYGRLKALRVKDLLQRLVELQIVQRRHQILRAMLGKIGDERAVSILGAAIKSAGPVLMGLWWLNWAVGQRRGWWA